jgi:hypothetical protein
MRGHSNQKIIKKLERKERLWNIGNDLVFIMPNQKYGGIRVEQESAGVKETLQVNWF